MEKEIVHFKVVNWVLEYAEFEELFIKFLCKEEIFFQYMYNLNKFSNVQSNAKTMLEVFIYEKDKGISIKAILMNFIGYSFLWNETPEGSHFWNTKQYVLSEYINQFMFIKNNVKL